MYSVNRNLTLSSSLTRERNSFEMSRKFRKQGKGGKQRNPFGPNFQCLHYVFGKGVCKKTAEQVSMQEEHFIGLVCLLEIKNTTLFIIIIKNLK